jgi:hypothetical protein
MAYLYRHIRLDKNEPFYIGIGTDKRYYRAFMTIKRNNIWYKITDKTDFKVEIVFDNLTWDEACNKEKEFIAIYGRKDSANGILCNLTDGGEGAIGRKYITSEETKAKLSKAHKGKKSSEETKQKLREIFANRVFSESHLAALKKGWITRKVKSPDEETRKKIASSLGSKPFKVFDLKDNFVGEFYSKAQVSRELNISKTMVYKIFKGEKSTIKGFKFKY